MGENMDRNVYRISRFPKHVYPHVYAPKLTRGGLTLKDIKHCSIALLVVRNSAGTFK